MLDNIKYIKIDENGIAGQDARSKEWYCKEIPFKDEKDLRDKIGKINKVLNEYNKNAGRGAELPKCGSKKRKNPPTPSLKNNKVKGLE